MDDLADFEQRQRLFDRGIAPELAAARADTPVVLLIGPRQAGKSTLAKQASQTGPGQAIRLQAPGPAVGAGATISRYATLDDATVRAAVEADPQGWLQSRKSADWNVIDEVQRVPDLLVAIKRDVDEDRRPNRFLLTGSSDLGALPMVAESLAGRVEVLQLWPLAQSEIEGTSGTFLAGLFAEDLPEQSTFLDGRDAIVARALRGGFPDVLRRPLTERRNAWFGSYITTVLQREIKTIANIADDAAIVRILRSVATQSGGPRKFQDLSRDTGTPVATLTRYVDLLKATFLISEVPAWFTNIDKRLMKSPKLLIADSGLYGFLRGLTDTADVGGLIETFAGTELLKLIGFAGSGKLSLLHLRTRTAEVDYVVERSDGRIVGLEVKAATSVSKADFKGLRELAGIAGERFVRGIVLYTGRECQPFGPDLWAVPMPALWDW